MTQLHAHKRVAPSSQARRARARQKREGIIMLIVMLMLTMATGTALFTIQSTQYEQRASTAVLEANWARGIAECTTMAGLAFAEDTVNNVNPSLSTEWQQDNGGGLAKYSQKYGFPQPLKPPGASAGVGDESSSVELLLPPFAANTPPATGLQGFLPGERRSDSPNYPLYSDQDDQTGARAVPGLHYYRAHWLQEKLIVNPVRASGVPGKTRTVITGFAEVRVWNDPLDSSNVRELHELDAITRGYIDTN